MPLSLYKAFEAARRVVTVPLVYVDMCGDLAAGILFAQISFLCEYEANLVKVRGEYWLIRDRGEWERECRISPTQFDRARDVLETLGFIKVEKWKSPHKDMRPALHIRVCEEVVIAWMEQNLPNSGFLNSRIDVSSIRYREAVKELSLTEAGASLPKPDQALESVLGKAKSKPKYESKPAEEWLMNAIEALAKVKDRNSAKQTRPVRSDLAMFWKKRMAILCDGEFVSELTTKEVGQLGHILKSLGNRTPEVLDWVLQNWGTFTAEVVMQAASKGNQPPKPDMGYLLQHHEIAANLMGLTTSKGVDKAGPVGENASSTPATIGVVPPTPAITTSDDDAPVPLSEVEEFMRELNESSSQSIAKP